ncbi:MAG: hypothetical protein J7J82_05910 [Staphylothermus sp.]|nr:hypothetical protein [Staphylothermus sp.]
MGRTTPSHRMALIREYSRIKKLIEELPEDEKRIWLEILNGFEDTMNLYNNVVFSDPIEPMIIHVLRKLVQWCREK